MLIHALTVALVALTLPWGSSTPRGIGAEQAQVRLPCAGGAAELQLRAEDVDDGGRIAVELRVDARAVAQSWRVVLLHERTLVFKGLRRPARSHSFTFRRTLPDWPFRETVTARLTTSGGVTCRLEVRI